MTRAISLALLAAAATLAAALAPLTARAATPPGRIVYSEHSSWTDDYDIWSMNPDGTDQVNLTNTPEISEFDPNLSPDGTKIAFSVSLENPNQPGWWHGEIFTMNADGSGRFNVTDTSGSGESQPSWSPDGTRLALAGEVPGRVISTQSDIFTINANGTGRTRLTFEDYEEIQPAWSPLGDKIAISAVREGDWEILSMNTDGTGEVNLTNNYPPDELSREDRAPDWSPDGSKIVFMSQYDYPCCGDWEIWAMNADGSGQTNLTNNPAGDDYPSWSPDGTEIVFQSNRATGWQTDIWRMPAPVSLPLTAGIVKSESSARSSGSSRDSVAATTATATRVTFSGSASRPDWGPGTGSSDCTITGSTGADTLTGTSGSDILCGLGGNDVIRGGGGADTILGGAGRDKVTGGSGGDLLRGQGGDDTLTSLDGIAGNDALEGGRGTDKCNADAGDAVTGCP